VEVLLIVLAAVGWTLAVVLGVLYVRLLEQHGRAHHDRHRLATLVQELTAEPPDTPMLPIGSEVPDVVLTDLDGAERGLEKYRGEPIALVFFNPDCGYCRQLAPQLGELSEGSQRVVLVSSGEADELRSLATEHGWSFDILLDSDFRAVEAMEAAGTPTGYLIDAEGKIASTQAMGVEFVLNMISGWPESPEKNGRRDSPGIPVRDTSGSRLVRDGLEPGTIAPTFVLPDLDGTMRSLTDFRGRNVLLVFSDADCGPCDELAPDLVHIAKSEQDNALELVMISRGGRDENRRKAEEHSYPFPVLLQRSWEVSKQYGMFATPIAFLIDEDGVIAERVAMGGPAICELAAGNPPESNA
jgi:peroxiredoxin